MMKNSKIGQKYWLFSKEVYVQMAHNFLFMKVDVVCVESPIPIANQNLIFLLNVQQTCVYLRCV